MRAIGEGTIQIDFRFKTARCRERVRLAPTKANLAYCRGWKRQIEDEIARGTFDYSKHFPDSKHARAFAEATAGARLSEYMRAFLESLAMQVQPETLKEYENDAETIILGLNDPHLSALTRANIRQWIGKLDLSKSRIDNLLRPLRGSLRQAAEDGLIEKDPLKGYEVRRVRMEAEDDDIDPFTPTEVNSLGEGQLGDLWNFWAWTGPRSGEIIGLQHGDVAVLMAVRTRLFLAMARTSAHAIVLSGWH